MQSSRRQVSKSLAKSLAFRLGVFSLLSYFVFLAALTVNFFKMERAKFEILSDQISSTLKSDLMVKDEIAIRATLNRLLELKDILAIEVESPQTGVIQDSKQEFTHTAVNQSGAVSMLSSDVLVFERNYKLYPNTDELFKLKFYFANNARVDIFAHSLLSTLTIITILGLMLTFGSRILIDREMIKLSIDEEKSKLASRIFHLMKSDVKQMIELIDQNNELPNDKRVLMRTILRSIHGTASKFIKGEGERLYSIEQYERISAIDLIQEMIARKELEFSKRKPVRIRSGHIADAHLRTIPNELKLAISNIIDNAHDAEAPGGEIVIGCDTTDQLVLITIKDNGAGIPKERIGQVFEIGKSFKPNGNGLGLFQAKEIVTALGGEIEIASIEGKGTTVTISILRDFSASTYAQQDFDGFDFILIDDSQVRRLNGQKRAELKGKRLGAFENVAEFCRSVKKCDLNRAIPIYLDSDLGEEEPGEIAAKRLFYEMGFENITLYTAGDVALLRSHSMPWIKEIVSKDEVLHLPV